MVRRIHLRVHCAPLERQTQVGREVYKHLAPPEPEQPLVAVNSDAVSEWNDRSNAKHRHTHH